MHALNPYIALTSHNISFTTFNILLIDEYAYLLLGQYF